MSGTSETPPDHAAACTEVSADVHLALRRLPHQQRSVVVLRMWGELSYSEIAQILDRNETTVRSHMHHGLTALRKHLEPRMR